MVRGNDFITCGNCGKDIYNMKEVPIQWRTVLYRELKCNKNRCPQCIKDPMVGLLKALERKEDFCS